MAQSVWLLACCAVVCNAVAGGGAALRDSNSHGGRGTGGSSANVSSSLLSVGLGIAADGRSVSIDTFSFFGAGAFTTNFALPVRAAHSGGALVLPADSVATGAGALVPLCLAGCALSQPNASTVVLSGLTLPAQPGGGGGVLATEAWTLSLVNASSFSFTVDRVWVAPSAPRVAVDRIALSLQTTGGWPIHSQQIPGFVDLAMFLNETSTGGFDLGNDAFEFLSPASTQFVRFTPTGALFVVEGAAVDAAGAPAPVLWSFAKPFADGTTWCSIGFEAIDPRGGPAPAHAPGDRTRMTMTFTLVELDIPTDGKGAGPFPKMDVTLPNATLGTQMATLLGSQYQLMGWIMGNNPASSPCLHEMAWWPLMASLFPSNSLALPAMQQELSFFARCGYQPAPWGGNYEHVHSCSTADGARFGMMQRYAGSGMYNCPWGPLTDQDVMFPIAVYYTVTSSGDLKWLAAMRPALDAIATFLASRGLALGTGNPVVYVSPASGLADGGRHSANWYDVIEFGHFDAYLAVHGVWALQCLAEMYAVLGDAAAAANAKATHAQAVLDFNALFWDDAGAAYHDWIDTSGKARSYFYVDIAFVAIFTGVADARQTSALLGHYDTRLAEIYTTYNVTPGGIWSAPCNLYPVTDAKEIANNPQTPLPFPSYENGGSFFHTPGLQFAALGAAGRADEAFEGFSALMNSGFGEIRGWAQQLYWGHNGAPDSLVGGDPLNTAALSVWGFMRSAFGVAPSLSRGMLAIGKPAAAMQGARWTVSVLGEDVCLVVGAGVTTFCNGTALPSA